VAKEWQLNIRANADTGEAEDGLKGLGDSGSKFGGIMSGLAAGAGFAALDGLSDIAKAGWEQMDALDAVSAQSAGTIKNLGAGTKLTTNNMAALAHGIQGVTDVQETQIQSAENIIASMGGVNTSTKSGMAVFDQATKLTVNMAKAMGTSVPGAAKSMAKSMQDAANGVLLLPKGMKLSSAQTADLTAKLKDLTSPTARQAALLDVLGTKWGKAAPLDAAQKLDVAKKSMTDLAAAAETHLTPAISAAASGIQWLANEISVGIHSQGFQNAMTGIGNVVREVVAVVKQAWPAIQQVIDTTMTQVEADIKQVTPEIQQTFQAIGQIIQSVTAAAMYVWKNFGTQITTIIKTPLMLLLTLVTGEFKIVENLFVAFSDLLHGDWSGFWGHLGDAVKAAFTMVVQLIEERIKETAAVFELLGGLILNAMEAAGNAIGQGALDLVDDLVQLDVNIMQEVVQIGEDIINGIIKGIDNAAGALTSKLSSVAGDIKHAIKNPLGILSPSTVMRDEVGAPIVQGIVVGMQKEHANLITQTTTQASKVLAAAKSVYQSSLAKGLGSGLTDTIAAGIKGGTSTISAAIQSAVSSAMETANIANLGAAQNLAQISVTSPGDVQGQAAQYQAQITAAQTQQSALQTQLTAAQKALNTQGPTIAAYQAEQAKTTTYLAELGKETQTTAVKAAESQANATLATDKAWLATQVVTQAQVDTIQSNLTDSITAQANAQQALDGLGAANNAVAAGITAAQNVTDTTNMKLAQLQATNPTDVKDQVALYNQQIAAQTSLETTLQAALAAGGSGAQIAAITQNLTDAYGAQASAQQAISNLPADGTNDGTGGGTTDNSVTVNVSPQQWNGDPSMIAWFVKQAMQGGSNAVLGTQPVNTLNFTPNAAAAS
jgi:hypothetical protein